jgi:Fe2+ or Zn2+ uptake regulation protein
VRIETQGAVRPALALAEEPHAHIVCRSCGRIQSVELTELDRFMLTHLAEEPPKGWSVDGIAFSMTGACRRCREGPPA